MHKIRAFWFRLLGLLHSSNTADDFSAELASHIAMHTEDGVRAGLAPEEARRRALIRLGGAEQTRQSYRERRTLPWLENLVRDLRFSLRMLAKHPAATAVAIFSIGLGIGANATIFAMVSRFILRPAPVGDPATLLALYPSRGMGGYSWSLYNDLREQATSFSGVAGYWPLLPTSIAGGQGEPERVWGQAVTANFFDVTGLHMLHGRGFLASEDRDPVVVLGAGLWRRRFQADPAIVGRTVNLSGRSFTVVGIAPVAFHSVDQFIYSEFWVPINYAGQILPFLGGDRTNRESSPLFLVARLRAGTTRASAAAELNGLAKRYAAAYPKTDKDDAFVVETAGILPSTARTQMGGFFAVLGIVTLLVLSIAAFNVASLLFAQAAARQREMAVRLALGATRIRLRRQILIESLLLGLGGGLLGVLLSCWATEALSAIRLPMQIPIDLGIGIDWRALLATLALSIVSGLLLGVAPAWVASRPLLANALKGEDALARPVRRWTLRNLLTVAQIAIAAILLSLTGLFLRSLESAASIDLGFQPHGLLAMSIDPQAHGYTPDRTIVFLAQVRDRVAAVRGVASAAFVDYAPLSMTTDADSFRASGGQESLGADIYRVTSGYFQTMRIPLIAGRDLGGESATGPKTAIVNRTFAERMFHGVNPVGQTVTAREGTFEIVGVAGDAELGSLEQSHQPALYRPISQSIGDDMSLVGYTLLVRTAGDPNALREPIRRQIHALDPSMAIFNEETMDEHIRNAYFFPRLAATLFGVFGGMGLALAIVGLYGVIGYSVSRRTREFGIRIAMGARPGTVERLVLHQGLILALIAVALGWPAAWMLAKLSSSFLYGIQPHDALTFAAVPFVLIAVALAACWIPARRAARVDPMVALRSE
jgi:predicted permease